MADDTSAKADATPRFELLEPKEEADYPYYDADSLEYLFGAE